MFQGLEGSVMRRELAWSEMMVEWVFIEGLARDSLGSGRGSCKGSCMFWFLGMFQGLGGSGGRRGLC